MKTRISRILLCCILLIAVTGLIACDNGKETGTTAETTSETTTDAATDADTDSETATKAETGTETETETIPETDTETGSVTETVTETETATETETETESPEEAESRKQEEMKAMYDATEEKLLPIGGWSTPAAGLRNDYTGIEDSYDRAWQLLADAHLNYMITLEEWSSHYWTLDSASSAYKAGIKLWYNCTADSAGSALERINAILNSEYADVLEAIYLKDEPTLNDFDEVKSLYDGISAGLTEHELTYLANLLPTYAASNLIGNDYRTYVRNYLETVKPDILMFDYYPFVNGDNVSSMLVNNVIAIQEANRAGVPLYTFIQSSGFSGSAEPTEEQLRLNVQINLATGSKGIAYFVVCEYAKDWGYTPALTYDGKTTALYDKIKSVNEDVLAMKGVYLDYTCEGMMIANVSGLSRLLKRNDCSDFVLSSYGELTNAETSGHFVIGCFANEAGEHGYYIVNTSTKSEGTVTLTFDPTCEQSYTLWGEDGLSDMGAASGEVTVTLAPGAGAFLRLEPPSAD